MIIARYLIKEVSHALLAVTLVLLLVFLSNQLVRFLGYAASGKIAASAVLHIMGFEVSFLLALLLPLGLYLGIVSTYGRLYADNELRAMQASGLGMLKLVQITISLACVVTAIVLVLTLWINPLIAAQKDKLISQGLTSGNVLDNLEPGRFQSSGDENRIFYVEGITRNHHQARNLFVAEQKNAASDETGNAWTVLSAAKGYQVTDPVSKDSFVVAEDGYRYEGTPGQNAYKIIQFKKYAVRIPDQTMEMQHQAQEMIPTHILWQHYFRDVRNAAELQWRISMPLSVLLLALLAIPLSHVRPRQSRYISLFPAILIYVVYVEMLFVARDWVEQKTVSVGIGLWWVHGILVLLIAMAFIWQCSFVRKNQ